MASRVAPVLAGEGGTGERGRHRDWRGGEGGRRRCTGGGVEERQRHLQVTAWRSVCSVRTPPAARRRAGGRATGRGEALTACAGGGAEERRRPAPRSVEEKRDRAEWGRGGGVEVGATSGHGRREVTTAVWWGR